ncbi:hypothetical protein C8T65DRAFT_739119 [Cerioporus squamosus]|nr:hypothetical protein C8T65DRAFT_739119 [Cerioporus squamosus]
MNDFDIVAFAETFQTGTFIGAAPRIFLLYDHLITIDREVELFRASKLTSGASIVYAATRYIAFIYNVLSILMMFPEISTQVLSAIDYARYLPLSAFSGMRAFALCKNRIISSLILVLSLAPLAANLAQFAYHFTGFIEPIVGCLTDSFRSRTGVTVSDLLLVMLTWRSTAVRPIENPFQSEGTRRTLSSILLWNGTLYFIVLSILSVLQLSFTLSSILNTGGESFVILFTEPLTTVLICRFILDLHEASQREMKLDSDDPLRFSFDPDHTPSFVRSRPDVIGATILPAAFIEGAPNFEWTGSALPGTNAAGRASEETSDGSRDSETNTMEDRRHTRLEGDAVEGPSRIPFRGENVV